jgi:hypothetical protein
MRKKKLKGTTNNAQTRRNSASGQRRIRKPGRRGKDFLTVSIGGKPLTVDSPPLPLGTGKQLKDGLAECVTFGSCSVEGVPPGARAWVEKFLRDTGGKGYIRVPDDWTPLCVIACQKTDGHFYRVRSFGAFFDNKATEIETIIKVNMKTNGPLDAVEAFFREHLDSKGFLDDLK